MRIAPWQVETFFEYLNRLGIICKPASILDGDIFGAIDLSDSSDIRRITPTDSDGLALT